MFLIELIGDMIIDGWFALMQWIVPEKSVGKYTRMIIKIVVGIFTCLLFFIMLLGIFAMVSDDPDTKQLGKLMVFIPLGISAAQILLGAILRAFAKKRG